MSALPAQNFDVEATRPQVNQPDSALAVTDYGNGAKGIDLVGGKSLYISPRPITIQKVRPVEANWITVDSMPTDATTSYISTNQVYTYRTTIDNSIGTAATTWNLNTVRDNMARQISTDHGFSYDGLQTAISTDSISVTYTGGTTSASTYDYRIYFSTDATDATGYAISGYAAPSIKDFIKEIVRSNLLIRTGRNRSSLPTQVSAQELKARDTLRDMLSESDWRRYVTNGFIMVKGGSGFAPKKVGPEFAKESGRGSFWYQIFNDRRRIKIFRDGKEFAQICIHTANECPPSDHVINMKVLVELDEEAIWNGGNVHFTKSDSLSASLASGSLSFDSGTGTIQERVKRLRESYGIAVA